MKQHRQRLVMQKKVPLQLRRPSRRREHDSGSLVIHSMREPHKYARFLQRSQDLSENVSQVAVQRCCTAHETLRRCLPADPSNCMRPWSSVLEATPPVDSSPQLKVVLRRWVPRASQSSGAQKSGVRDWMPESVSAI